MGGRRGNKPSKLKNEQPPARRSPIAAIKAVCQNSSVLHPRWSAPSGWISMYQSKINPREWDLQIWLDLLSLVDLAVVLDQWGIFLDLTPQVRAQLPFWLFATGWHRKTTVWDRRDYKDLSLPARICFVKPMITSSLVKTQKHGREKRRSANHQKPSTHRSCTKTGVVSSQWRHNEKPTHVKMWKVLVF